MVQQDLVTYTAMQPYVVGRQNKRYPLNQPLVPAGHFPRDGWAAKIRVKGIVRELQETTAKATFDEAVRLLELNGETMDPLDLWLNLNLQWVPRVANKYQLVTPQSLLQIATPLEP